MAKKSAHVSNSAAQSSAESNAEVITVDSLGVDKLHKNALGLPGVLYFCLAGAAPIAAMFFNVPIIASQAGAATPLVLVLSAIGLLMLGVSIVYFSRRLTSAGGFYTWISHALGARTAFQSGWLMLGGYAIFEAASQAAFGALTDMTVTQFFGFQMPGGWVTYSLLGIIAVSALAYFDVKWSAWVLAPFLLLELGSLVVFNLAMTFSGGAQGHDFVHTLTPAGASLEGVAPGGLLGIGVAMAIGVWCWVGFEAGAVYGEESRNPRRTVPVAIFGVIAGLAVLYIWTTYSVVIGHGWTEAGKVLGNIQASPSQYLDLAGQYVGGWLVVCMLIAISAATFSGNLAFHNGMTRYFYSMGREQILPAVFGKTHPRWKSPHIASIVQSVFTVLVILFLGLIIQRSLPDGSAVYGLGFADGQEFTQTSGIVSFSWLATIGTIAFMIVYVLTNIAAPVFARQRGEFRVLTHIVAPVISIIALLIPLTSFLLPPIPGVGDFITSLGFYPTPFPLNILPLFVIGWVLIGLVYSFYLERANPEKYKRLGRVVSGDAGSDDAETSASDEAPATLSSTAVKGDVPVTKGAAAKRKTSKKRRK